MSIGPSEVYPDFVVLAGLQTDRWEELHVAATCRERKGKCCYSDGLIYLIHSNLNGFTGAKDVIPLSMNRIFSLPFTVLQYSL